MSVGAKMLETLTRRTFIKFLGVFFSTPLAFFGTKKTVPKLVQTSGLTEIKNSRFLVIAGMDDAPHLTQRHKDELWSVIPPEQLKQRFWGIP